MVSINGYQPAPRQRISNLLRFAAIASLVAAPVMTTIIVGAALFSFAFDGYLTSRTITTSVIGILLFLALAICAGISLQGRLTARRAAAVCCVLLTLLSWYLAIWPVQDFFWAVCGGVAAFMATAFLVGENEMAAPMPN